MSLPSAIPTAPIAELDVDAQKLAVDKKREHDLSRKWAHGIRDAGRRGPLEPGAFYGLENRWDVPARNHGVRDAAMKAKMKIRPITPG